MSICVWRRLAAFFLAVLVVGLSPSWAAAQARPRPASTAQVADIDAFVARQMKARHIPGVSIAVLRDGAVVLTKGYGLADVENTVPATESTMYQLASVTKQFTATAVLQLVEDGKLTLATPLRSVLPDMPEAWGAVTIAQLLNHTSGIPSYTSVPDFGTMMRKDFTPAELIGLVRDRPMDFAPGEKWRYNNSGYVLLGMLVEKIAGQPWGTVLDTRLFTPAGMPTARVNDLSVIVPHRAQGYAWVNGELRNGDYVSPTQPYAAGALIVSVLDLAKWDETLVKHPLLSPASLAAMYTPAPIADGKTHPYGFGWDVSPYRGHTRYGHGGGIPGFSTYYARFVDDKLSVIVLANEGSGGAERIANGIAEFYIPALRDGAPKPITDTNPTQSAFLKSVVMSMGTGTGEKAWFTPEAQAFFFPDRIKEGKYRIGGFGALRSFQLMEESTTDKGQLRSYLADFDGVGLRCTFTLAADGKIAGVGLRLE
ncbi:MAG TPA: serine hydrolase domain-containing protein [Luteitalea sp.]|nr:serine hydrolase domain-containing protein [Luteitalea sp.]